MKEIFYDFRFWGGRGATVLTLKYSFIFTEKIENLANFGQICFWDKYDEFD